MSRNIKSNTFLQKASINTEFQVSKHNKTDFSTRKAATIHHNSQMLKRNAVNQ